MRDADGAADLEQLLADRGEQLMRTAALLAGSHQDGEDLLQAALERMLRLGRRIESSPEGYLRRTLYHLAADGWRRQGTWRRKPGGVRSTPRPRTGTGGPCRRRPPPTSFGARKGQSALAA